MVAENTLSVSEQEAVLNAAEEVVSRAAMAAFLEKITDRPRQLYLRGTRTWWGHDARRTSCSETNVVWCRDRR